ncbi:1-acyl-sn-glycerol-3-phosphate acyltransferase [Cobetia sp. L2A1]|uniref:1-acyl-sn-glycerol-3-phosphate acyltransferase n=1 Tax=Cobetia sp. L2A1 TaxID=2686360 RepID=UPI00131A7A1B|nr:1-acyl-sn-glycerol-3-phosphate acyltransferase [Cobetia sp. L2A1]
MTDTATPSPATTAEQDPFADIRPYRDNEVAEVLVRLEQDRELLDTLTRFRMPGLTQRFPWLARQIARLAIKREMRGVKDVASFQSRIAGYMARMIHTTTTSFETAGLERLSEDTPYLFLSNHRDISLDPAFVNYALYRHGRNTVRIAIGDNLLQKPFVTDVMRLNKSFIVPRSAKGKRAMLAAYQALSGYIRHSLTHDKHSIWLAQREGRAKDGRDGTETAIIKMLTMSARMADKTRPFSETVSELNIVPVSISYEFDPCDLQKARELAALANDGRYEKVKYEDIQSIAAGISGHKGRVKLVFGEPLKGDFETPEDVVAEVDRQVLEHYTLYPSHQLALEKLAASRPLLREEPRLASALDVSAISGAERATFENRLAGVPAELRDWWLVQYANPILNREGLSIDLDDKLDAAQEQNAAQV